MRLPTTYCPVCKTTVLIHRTLVAQPGSQEGLETRCLDCNERLDRFGLAPVIADMAVGELRSLGYHDLDRPEPIGPGGCFATRGCEGCSKIDSRPW
ncbi:MAG: hypothetical protein VX498_08295 [Myxococcota bacterium]|nr:hypothetical protein [Myxococcota bacterium]